VAALYTTDAKLMVPGSEPGTGPKAIQKLIAGDIALGGKLTLKTEDVVGFGDYALETGKWVGNSPDGKHLDHGPYLTLYKKTDGAWKISRDIWNSSMPPSK
jgi:ketosteroid isomerase-like protein